MSSWVSHNFLFYFILLLLLPAIYAVFGWYTAEQVPGWSRGVMDLAERMELSLTLEIIQAIGYGLAIAVILLVHLSLTLMTKPMTILFSSCFKSDFRAVISVLGWAFTVTLIVRWLNYFFRIFLLFCVAMLCCLELQQKGYNKWTVFLLLTGLSLTSFILGAWSYGQFYQPLASAPASY
jgi:hypothetical protein